MQLFLYKTAYGRPRGGAQLPFSAARPRSVVHLAGIQHTIHRVFAVRWSKCCVRNTFMPLSTKDLLHFLR